MRIHHLSLAAVGPFPGAHEIDVDQLSAGGLFLLEGPTGAGKSTLIDAITFGLYGSLGSPERDDRLPSAHAPAEEPVIEVVFSTGAGVFRVRRTPAYERPKRRGAGTTRQNATARLWRLAAPSDDVGEPLAATAQEVGTEIQRIVGLNRIQFSQTVVLPQGRFATFLRAKPTDRADVLQDVFGTAIYQRVQDELVDLAKQARRELAAARQEVGSCVRAFGELLPEHDDAPPGLTQAGEDLDAVALKELTTRCLGRAEADRRRARSRATAAERAERSAQEDLDAQRDLEQRLRRRRELLTEQEQLGSRAPQVAMLRECLSAGRRAATVSGALRGRDLAHEELGRAGEELEQECVRARTGTDADLAEHADPATLRAVVEELTGTRGGLTPLAELEAGLPARTDALEREEVGLAARRSVLAEREAVLEQRPAERARLATALERIQRAAPAVPVAEALVMERRRVRDAARDVEGMRADLDRATADVAAAAGLARQALDGEHAVRDRWIAGMAGELARKLSPGDACAVCGATEHPAPAPRAPDHASDDDVEAARDRRERAGEELAAARETRGQVEARLRARETDTGSVDLPGAEDAAAEAEQELCAARDALRTAELRRAQLASFDEGTEGLREEVGDEAQTLAVLAEQLRGLRERLEVDAAACLAAAGDRPSVTDRLSLLNVRLDLAQRLCRAVEAHRTAERRLDDAGTALAEALREADFTDAAQAAAAQLGTSRIAELEREIGAHDAAVARVRAGLAEEGIAGLAGDEVADVGTARATHAARRAALGEVTEAAARAEDLLERLARARHGLLAVLRAHAEATETAGPVLRMGELAAAGEGNAKATTLSTYVLLRRFEDVVAAANERLAVMSDGRYSLVRIDGREGRSRKAGLGLCVRDHVTESSRDPHTLSGGETFYVSLCLALGLADVVTSEAGGTALDTLFVDEGFGSLDPHTLDGVLGELDRLQAGGRAVGIVSHVSELKERIADRIEVRRAPEGTSTLKVRAGA